MKLYLVSTSSQLYLVLAESASAALDAMRGRGSSHMSVTEVDRAVKLPVVALVLDFRR